METKRVANLYRNGIISSWEHNILYQESKNMALETQDGAPIPMTLMDKLDRYERRARN